MSSDRPQSLRSPYQELPPTPRSTEQCAPTARSRHGTADECFEAMRRHHDQNRAAAAGRPFESRPVAPATCGGSEPGDIIYGAEAIARFIFADYAEREPKQCRRRVYHLWSHYRDRNERAGLLKLNGALCLSKSQWRKFHGLG